MPQQFEEKALVEEESIHFIKHSSFDLEEIFKIIIENKKNTTDKIIFLSFIRSYIKIMRRIFMDTNFNNDIIIVDFVSRFIINEIKDRRDVLYRKPPNSLDEFKTLLTQIIQSRKGDILVIDSLNQLLSFSDISEKSFHDFLDFLKNIPMIENGETIKKILLFYDTKSYRSINLNQLDDVTIKIIEL